MFVRAFDEVNNQYYKSMVYGLINSGCYEQAILFNPHKAAFEIIPYFNKKDKQLKPLYECINGNEEEWVVYEKVFLLKLKKYLKEHNCSEEITLFRGYQEVFNDFEFILRLLQEKQVSLETTTISLRECEDKAQWHYIQTKEEARELMRLFAGFHDAILDRMIYEEDYGKAQLRAVLDNSTWYGVIELCFEGLVALNLRPPLENQTRYIYDATLIIKDETVFWADTYLETEDLNYTGTYIKALNLKWRRIS